MSVVDTVEILRGERLSEEEYFEVALLGWGVELVSDHLVLGSVSVLLIIPLSSRLFSSSQMT